MTVRNMYYNPVLIDLSKMRADAIKISNGDDRNAPQKVVIHHHKFTENCDGAQGLHEVYEARGSGTDTGIRL